MRKIFLALALVLSMVCGIAGPSLAGEQPAAGTEILTEILERVQQYHISEPAPDILIQGAIEGIINTLHDPHTEYMSPERLEDFNISLDGEYVGIGLQLQPGEHFPVVVGVIANTPAEKAGLKINDQIIKVDSTNIADQPLDLVVQKIRGPQGTSVKLTIRREGTADFELSLTRADIDMPTVSWEILDDGAGYIRINKFGTGTSNEVRTAVTKIKQQGATGLILDLRGNPGGILEEAVRVTSNFVPSGKLVVSTKDKNGTLQEHETSGEAIGLGMRIAVLVDSHSASAAEILAGALQDYRAATLIGSATYGKGTVQIVIPLRAGGALKVTVAEYHTPKGRTINGIGLEPDIQVLTPGLQVAAAQRFLQLSSKNVVGFDTGKTQALVNGTPVETTQTVLKHNGITYVPLRFAFEALGYEVDWQTADNSVRITGYDSDVCFGAEDGRTVVNGQVSTGWGPLLIKDAMAFIPLINLDIFDIHYVEDGTNLIIEKVSAVGNET